ELSLTAIDDDGLSATRTVALYPRTVKLSFASSPPGMQLSVGSDTQPTPFDETVIAGSLNTITAADPQGFGDGLSSLTKWYDGLRASHSVTAPDSGTASYSATYARPPRTSLLGAEVVGERTATAQPGFGQVYYNAAGSTGVAHSLRLYLDASNEASRVELA